MTISEAAAGLRARKFSSREMVDESLKLIANANPKINAFITVTEESARARAALVDEELAHGIDRGPLHGLPIAHKDLVDDARSPHDGGLEDLCRFRSRSSTRDIAKLLEDARRGDGRQDGIA